MERSVGEIARDINPEIWDRPSLEGSDKYTFILLALDRTPKLDDSNVEFVIATQGKQMSLLDRIRKTRINERQALVVITRNSAGGKIQSRFFWYNNPTTQVVLITTNQKRPVVDPHG